MSKAIQKSIKKTVLVKRTGEKIIVNIPFDKVYEAMQSRETIKISEEHVIRTSAINEYYGYNCVDEIEIWITMNFPSMEKEIMEIIAERKKSGKTINKAIVANIVDSMTKKE